VIIDHAYISCRITVRNLALIDSRKPSGVPAFRRAYIAGNKTLRDFALGIPNVSGKTSDITFPKGLRTRAYIDG
jgi:hypothetical protein